MDIDRNRFRIGNNPKTDWTDWLKNDPPAASVRQELRQKKVAQANRYTPRAAVAPPHATATEKVETPPNITVNINIPKFNLPRFKLKKPKLNLPAINYRHMAIGLAVAVLLAGGAWLGLSKWHEHTSANDNAMTAEQPDRTAPSFTPVAPKDKPQLANFSPDVTHYDGHHDTYSYSDLLPGGHFTVSEQPLPANLGPADQALAALAGKAGAKQQISTAAGTAFISTDPKSGSQLIICSVKGLLIFINSPYGHNSGTWKDYIGSLQ